MNRACDCLADCHSLFQVVEYHRGADVLIARLHYDAFQISITHGDQARASSSGDGTQVEYFVKGKIV